VKQTDPAVRWIQLHYRCIYEHLNERHITSSGQPNMENGNRPEENHVSRTSSSCFSVIFELGTPNFFDALTSASSLLRPLTQYLSSVSCVEIHSNKKHHWHYIYMNM
jgi:hypothetical protein